MPLIGVAAMPFARSCRRPSALTCRESGVCRWHTRHVNWSALLALDDGIRLRAAASEAEIRLAETDLRARLPETLRRLYLLTGGVWDEPGQLFRHLAHGRAH